MPLNPREVAQRNRYIQLLDDRTAAAMVRSGVASKSTIYFYAEDDRRGVPEYLLKLMLDVSDDDELRRLLESPRYMLVRRWEARVPDSDSLALEGMDIPGSAAAFIQRLRQALTPRSEGGRRIGPDEARELRHFLSRHKDEISEFEALLDQIERKEAGR